MPHFPFTFEHGILGGVALLLAAAIMGVAVWRRPAVPRATLVLACAGLILLILAASGVAWLKPLVQPIAVMVDLSPSTRGAAYRDPAVLDRRVRELLGTTPFTLSYFSDRVGAIDPAVAPLPDLASNFSELPATDAPAILLFSDGRLISPRATTPVFAALDAALDEVSDAAVVSLNVNDDIVHAGVRNTGTERHPLSLRGVGDESLRSVSPGSFTLTLPAQPGSDVIAATMAPGDRWPENDSLQTFPPPPAVAERWWVGDEAPGSGWKTLSPQQLPSDVGRYLAPAIIVLHNQPADALDAGTQTALRRYVSDLGGSLLILGGERAFAAGGYAGNALEVLSPLASTPPEPTVHWQLVADASGSMNQPANGGRTRWQYAANALTNLLPWLPPADQLSIGSFAADLQWWSQNRSVADTRTMSLPPANVRPGGATNLDAALRAIVADSTGHLPVQLLLATDAQATIADPEALAGQLKAKNVHVHVLLIGEESEATGLPALRTIIAATGGSLRNETSPENWAGGLRELMRSAQPGSMQREPLRVRFVDPLSGLGTTDTTLWNRTWPKSTITPLAIAEAGNERLTMAARWNVGEGQVAAAAFAPSPEQVERLAGLVARPPRDPRFQTSWDIGSDIRVVIDAKDQQTYLNGERFSLQVQEGSARADMQKQVVPQIAPGQYALTIPATRSPALVTLRHGEQIIDCIATPGRYVKEFDGIGNDRAALAQLARRTGGAVIEPGVTKKLDLPWPRRSVFLVSWFAIAGATLLAAGLVRWRLGS